MSVRGTGEHGEDRPTRARTGGDEWASRWTQLARGAGLHPTEPVVLALSGGADSVFLLHALAAARPRPRTLAVHVDHRLRGEESLSDAAFCARTCARLSVPFARREVEVDPDAPNLEARAREARYRALADEARGAGIPTILTGHHEDDALETLLLRWMRGTSMPGLAGLKARNVLRTRDGARGRRDAPLSVVRPLLHMRREEVRRLLRDAGHRWCEDSSNQSARFTRNRVRNDLLPEIERACGEEGVENLRAFATAVESFEEELAGRTAHLTWSDASNAPGGRTLERARLVELAPPLLRRALWRLLSEGTRLAPSGGLLAILEDDLRNGRTTRRSLPGGWTLHVEDRRLVLSPPGGDAPAPAEPPRETLRLGLPGRVALGDGRTIEAELVTVDPGAEPPRVPELVELDASDLPGELVVRWIRAGDRFHGLGAPGGRPLRRFLADCGIPASERRRVPLVFAGEELLWVAGVRPSEGRRLDPRTVQRLRLCLRDAAPAESGLR